MRRHAALAAVLAAAMIWFADASTAKAYTVNPLNQVMEVAEAANVRAGPGTGYDVRYVLYEGATVRVTGAVQERDWLRIDLRGDGGRGLHLRAAAEGDVRFRRGRFCPIPAGP